MISLIVLIFRYTDFANNNLYDIYSTCSGGPGGFSPCVANDALSNLMNNDSFRSVIHAANTATIGLWYDCTPHLNYTSNYHSIAEQVWPTILQLDSTLRIMIYSGDADSCVPFFGTRQWTRTLGGAVTDDWRPWQYSDPNVEGTQLAGYTIGYTNLRFTTLKGIGHMAPRTAYFNSLYLFIRYPSLIVSLLRIRSAPKLYHVSELFEWKLSGDQGIKGV